LQQLITGAMFRSSRNSRMQEGSKVATIEIKTEITGNVWKIVAVTGQAMDEDEPILILESMKMEIPVAAPEAGRLVAVLVEEGVTVSEGTVVARMEV
jgi:acetyl-CoA carboxylase biotin carboxyl carrier protein